MITNLKVPIGLFLAWSTCLARPAMVRAEAESSVASQPKQVDPPEQKPPQSRATKPVVPNPALFAPDGWNAQVVSAILDAEKNLTSLTLADFVKNHPTEGRWIELWCGAKTSADDSRLSTNTKEVCESVKSGKEDKIPIFELASAVREQNPPNCSGFGVTVPLFGIRLLKGGGTSLNGPVQAGLGGGYYWGNAWRGSCRESFSTGPEFFAYSEGLDPSGKFQIGIGAGWQFVAFQYFQFGFALGWDVYRREQATSVDASGATTTTTTSSGLLALQNVGPRPSLTFLLTFAVTGGATQTQNANQGTGGK